MHVVKVWSADRKKKAAIMLFSTENMMRNIMETGSKKLNIVAHKIVLEEDGTEMDEDEILLFFMTEMKSFILLEFGQEWVSANPNTEDDFSQQREETTSKESCSTNDMQSPKKM